MLAAVLFIPLLTLALCSEITEPFLCLQCSTVWYNQPTLEYVLSATDCHKPETDYFLTRDGKILLQSGMPDASKLVECPLFSSEFAARSTIQFLKPFFSMVDWKSIRNNGMKVTHKDLMHFPISFWNEILPVQAAQLLASLETTEAIVELIKYLRAKEVPLGKFVLSASLQMPVYCHGPSANRLLYPGDSIVVCSTAARTGNGSPRAIIRQEAHVPIFLWKKLFEDDDSIQAGQPLYIFSKM